MLRKKGVEELPLTENSPPRMFNGVRISVFNPPSGRWDSEPASEEKFHNNQSLVLKVQFKDVSFLLAGDIEKESELIKQMLKNKGYTINEIIWDGRQCYCREFESYDFVGSRQDLITFVPELEYIPYSELKEEI